MRDALRVLHVTPAYAPAYRYGGPIRSVEGLVEQLAHDGATVLVLTTDADGPLRLKVQRGWHHRNGVLVRYLPRWLPPDLAPELLWETAIWAQNCDVVHVTALFSAPSAIALAAAFAVRVPVVFSPRGALEGPALGIGNTFGKRAWVGALKPLLAHSVLHATSEQERDSIRSVLGDSVQVEVIPNGTELEAPRAALARRARLRAHGNSRFLVGAVGRIHPIKALERLVEAIALLRSVDLDVELQIAGPIADHDYAASLRRQIEASNLSSTVSLVGELNGEEKLDFYARCDLLCLCSRSENFGNVVVEALAAYTPVVASRHTPWQSLERAGAGAWVHNDAPSLASAISAFALDAELASRAGRNGRELVEREFTWQAVAKKMRALYERMVE